MNEAYFWHGSDLADVGSLANNEYYQKGLNFSSQSHDLWGLGSKKVKGSSSFGSWSFKYETTGAEGETTFMKLSDDWKDAQKPGESSANDLGQ